MKERDYWKHSIKDKNKKHKMFTDISKKLLVSIDKNNSTDIIKDLHTEDGIKIEDELLYITSTVLWIKNEAKTLARYKSEIMKTIRNNKNELDKMYTNNIVEIGDIFINIGENPILKMPRYVDDMLNICYIKHLYNELGIDKSGILKEALHLSISYFCYKIVGAKSSKLMSCIENLDDDLAMLSMITIMYWYMSDNCKLYKIPEFIEYIKLNLGETYEEAIEKEIISGNKIAKSYLEFKLNELKDNEENSYRYGKKFVNDVYTDFGRLKPSDFGLETFDEVMPTYFFRCPDLSFELCYSDDNYKSILDIENKFERKTIFDLINRYLNDNSERIYTHVIVTLASEKCSAIQEELNLINFDKEKKNLNEQIERSKIKIKGLKSDNKELDKKIDELRTKNNKTLKKLNKLNPEEIERKDTLISELELEIKELNKNKSKHDFEVERLNKIISKLNDKIKESEVELAKEISKNKGTKQRDDYQDNEVKLQSSSRDIPVDYLYNTFKDKKILLVGGDTIHKVLVQREYDSINLLKSDNVNFKLTNSSDYDLIVIFTKYVGHSVVERIESEAKNSNITAVRFNNAGANSLIHFLFMYFYGHNEIEAGKYIL